MNKVFSRVSARVYYFKYQLLFWEIVLEEMVFEGSIVINQVWKESVLQAGGRYVQRHKWDSVGGTHKPILLEYKGQGMRGYFKPRWG